MGSIKTQALRHIISFDIPLFMMYRPLRPTSIVKASARFFISSGRCHGVGDVARFFKCIASGLQPMKFQGARAEFNTAGNFNLNGPITSL